MRECTPILAYTPFLFIIIKRILYNYGYIIEERGEQPYLGQSTGDFRAIITNKIKLNLSV